MSRIYLSSPDTGELEESFVLDAMRSGWVAPLGPHVDAFEREVADRVGVGHGVALSSGTAALHLALVSWGIGPGDFIPTSTMTFAATANAITYTGATPVFIDSDSVTGNIDVDLLEHAVKDLRAQGKNVPAVVPVDLLGKCANYSAITQVAQTHDLRVLADAAESLGARHAGQAAGAFGDAAVLSFNSNKIMTTSGGGMLLTNDRSMAEHVKFLSTQAREKTVHYEHKEVGYNYRLSNLLAAVGRAQLSRLDAMLTRRRAHRLRYAELFSDVPGIEVFAHAGDEDDNCWLTAILVDEAVTGWRSHDLSEHLERFEIESRPLWKPMHLQPVYADRPSYLNGNSETLFNQGLTLPSGSVLSDQQTGRIDEAIGSFLKAHQA